MRSVISASIASLLLTVASAADSAKKYIFTSWELGDVSPEEVLLMADRFDATACDGVALYPETSLRGCDARRPRRVMTDPGVRDDEIAYLEPTLRSIARHPSLRESMLSFCLAPTNRIDWLDEAAWRRAGENLAAFARLAKRSGLKGFIIDGEDYWRQRQFFYRPSIDRGDYRTLCRAVRQRARDLCAPVFRAYPGITILSFQLLSTRADYHAGDDLAGRMVEMRDLLPSFVNGILDVMPPAAKLVDGNEDGGYHAEAERRDFYKRMTEMRSIVLPLVAKENRVKYRAQVSAGFGLYMDSYTSSTNSGWYKGPARGKRINRFEDNLRQATLCTDEYVWFWGEKGFWIDWPADLKARSGNPRWRSSGGGSWRDKYFGGTPGWGVIRPWRETMDGDFDLMARGVKEPMRCVREQRAKQIADGTFVNLAKRPGASVNIRADGPGSARLTNLAVDGWYGVVVRGRGEIVRGNVYFQHHGAWRWGLGAFRLAFGAPDADGWREGVALVRIPDGATDIYCAFVGPQGEKDAKVAFRDLEVFRIR